MVKEIRVNHIAKVEGHGKLSVDLQDGKVKCVQMNIFEGARYFEALVLGRNFKDVPEITSRICGICSQAHILCSIQAIEDALGVKVSKQTQELRELMMLSQLIQSHVLHLYFLALPDYVGFDNAVQMASKYKTEVARALKLKQFANKVVTVIGGREIHSIRPVVGGFTRVPSQEELDSLLAEFRKLKPEIDKTASLFSGIKYPKFERDTQYLAIRDKTKINYLGGNLLSSSGVKSTPENYLKYIKEKVVDYSNTKCVTLKNREFMVGALARINVNQALLSKSAKSALSQSKIKFPSKNPYHNNLAQAIELLDFFERSITILSGLKVKDEGLVDVKAKSGRGVSIVEAPRGLLFHDYEIDSKGNIKKANIIAPTTQNLKNIEEDIRLLIPLRIKSVKDETQLSHEMEVLVRAYDPCISCSTHFVEINQK